MRPGALSGLALPRLLQRADTDPLLIGPGEWAVERPVLQKAGPVEPAATSRFWEAPVFRHRVPARQHLWLGLRPVIFFLGVITVRRLGINGWHEARLKVTGPADTAARTGRTVRPTLGDPHR